MSFRQPPDLCGKAIHKIGEGLALPLVESEEQHNGRLRVGVSQEAELEVTDELIKGGDRPGLQAVVPCAS